MSMLKQATHTWCTYTVVPLKMRMKVVRTTLNNCATRHLLVYITLSSVVVDTNIAFEPVAGCVNENYIAT